MAHRYLLLARGGSCRRGLPGVPLQRLLYGRSLLGGARPCLAQVRSEHGGRGRAVVATAAGPGAGKGAPLLGAEGVSAARGLPWLRPHPVRRTQPRPARHQPFRAAGSEGRWMGERPGWSAVPPGLEVTASSVRENLRTPSAAAKACCRRKTRRHPRAAAGAASRQYSRKLRMLGG